MLIHCSRRFPDDAGAQGSLSSSFFLGGAGLGKHGSVSKTIDVVGALGAWDSAVNSLATAFKRGWLGTRGA